MWGPPCAPLKGSSFSICTVPSLLWKLNCLCFSLFTVPVFLYSLGYYSSSSRLCIIPSSSGWPSSPSPYLVLLKLSVCASIEHFPQYCEIHILLICSKYLYFFLVKFWTLFWYLVSPFLISPNSHYRIEKCQIHINPIFLLLKWGLLTCLLQYILFSQLDPQIHSTERWGPHADEDDYSSGTCSRGHNWDPALVTPLVQAGTYFQALVLCSAPVCKACNILLINSFST